MASVHDATFVCITDYELSMTNRHVYAALSVGSAALGFVGAAWQLANWGASLCPECGSGPSHDTRLGRLTSSMRGAMLLLIVRLALRGRRPPRTEPKPQQGRVRQRSRSNVVIVFNLALANLLACVGTSVRSVCMLLTGCAVLVPNPTVTTDQPNRGECYTNVNVQPTVGEDLVDASIVIESFTSYAYTAGWLWTLAYAVDVCRQSHVLSRTYQLPSKPWLMRYKLLCWGMPLVSLAACVALTVEHFPERCPERGYLIPINVISHVPLVFVMISTPILLTKSQNDTRRIVVQQTGAMTNSRRNQLTSQSRTFAAIVVTFLVCWLPNLIDVVQTIPSFQHCTEGHMLQMTICIWFTEAFLNPLQGLVNCFIYGRICGRVTHAKLCLSHCSCCVSSNQTMRETDGLLNARRRSICAELRMVCMS